jgi:Tfp pilus assembly protein PilN
LKEVPINRMNFLRRGEGGLTYKGAIYIFIVWVAFLGIIYGFQFFSYLSAKADVKKTKAKITELVKEKDEQVELVKKISTRKKGMTSQEDLESILTDRPRWSRIIKGMARALPPDVWLDTVKVTGGGEEWYTLVVTGKSKTQRTLTNFILKLESSGLFNKTALGKTKFSSKDGGVIDYDLTTQPVMKKLISENE